MSRNFKSDLNRGLAGQQIFAKLFADLKQTDGKRGDFLLPDSTKVEVKADFYNMNDTQNYFIERYSSIEVGSPGGPWQAAAHHAEYYAYLYIQNLHVSIWHTPSLLSQLEAIESSLKPVNVRNKSWTTVGYKVPRLLLVPDIVYEHGQINFKNSEFEPYFRAVWKLRAG